MDYGLDDTATTDPSVVADAWANKRRLNMYIHQTDRKLQRLQPGSREWRVTKAKLWSMRRALHMAIMQAGLQNYTLEDLEDLPDEQTLVGTEFTSSGHQSGDPRPTQLPVFRDGKHVGWKDRPGAWRKSIYWWERVKARGGFAYSLRSGHHPPGPVNGRKESGSTLLPVYGGAEHVGWRQAPEHLVGQPVGGDRDG